MRKKLAVLLTVILLFAFATSAFAAYNGTATVSAQVAGGKNNRTVKITITDDYGVHIQSFAYSSGANKGTYKTAEGYTVAVTFSRNTVKTAKITDYNPPHVPPVATYKITYNANGGINAPVDKTNYTAGTTATVLGAGNMARDGYTFFGWQNSVNVYKAGDKINVTKAITLYALWTKEIVVPPVEAYKITYDANGGINAPVDTTNYTAGTTATVLGAGNMTRDGYTFSGWQNGSDIYKAGDKINMTKAITLYALWTQQTAVPSAIVKVTTSAKNIVSITETKKNVWALTFTVTETLSNGSTKDVTYTVEIGKNSSGKINLGQYTLSYDIKGNGTNIKAFSVTMN